MAQSIQEALLNRMTNPRGQARVPDGTGPHGRGLGPGGGRSDGSGLQVLNQMEDTMKNIAQTQGETPDIVAQEVDQIAFAIYTLTELNKELTGKIKELDDRVNAIEQILTDFFTQLQQAGGQQGAQTQPQEATINPQQEG